MVEQQIRKRGIQSAELLGAMHAVPRHAFVPPELAPRAYADEPLAIGEGQTISQPYMVAAMTAAMELTGGERVLEVGTGSGYQTAILSLLAREVVSVESRSGLALAARERLRALGYRNVRVEVGDGTLGWPEAAPFEAILVTAGAPRIPPPLIEQLAEGGRLVIPVGMKDRQTLVRVRKAAGQTAEEALIDCQFVPLRGHYGWPET